MATKKTTTKRPTTTTSFTTGKIITGTNTRTTASATATKTRWTEEEINKMIAERAYHYFLERGARHGHDTDDWARAEKEIKTRIKNN